MELMFLGATGTVTGSKYLLTIGSKKILIDCGLFQGLKELRLRNWDKLPINPSTIDAVILTHAHIDHSGYLPLLAKNGFKGPIYCTPATKALCHILLPDSGYLQEEEAIFLNQHKLSKHKPALPLYTHKDAEIVLEQFETVEFGIPMTLFGEFQINFACAGHILGAALVQINFQGTHLLFSGDLGRPDDPIIKDPANIEACDYLIIESTYGNRLHDITPPLEQLATIINQTIKRGGKVIIPTFAVGRAQLILHYIAQLKQQKLISNIPVFLDSPMAISSTQILLKFLHEHHLSKKECTNISHAATYIQTQDESKEIDTYKKPIIIISASGMVTGGRVLHHIKTYGPDPQSTILFTGYQAAGTRGARILNGETEIKMLGQMVPIRAHIEAISNMSAHADSQQILDWLSHFKQAPKKIFITHGEPEATLALKTKIEQRFNWHCDIPKYLQKVKL